MQSANPALRQARKPQKPKAKPLFFEIVQGRSSAGHPPKRWKKYTLPGGQAKQ
jgi:hypothetical protein